MIANALVSVAGAFVGYHIGGLLGLTDGIATSISRGGGRRCCRAVRLANGKAWGLMGGVDLADVSGRADDVGSWA